MASWLIESGVALLSQANMSHNLFNKFIKISTACDSFIYFLLTRMGFAFIVLEGRLNMLTQVLNGNWFAHFAVESGLRHHMSTRLDISVSEMNTENNRKCHRILLRHTVLAWQQGATGI